ncbi:transposase [Streptomyces peucetius]|uniref:transposase n=1 Tax=Streptomyces peucetius TaxID=1950 RepID=UPI0039AF0047
MYAVRSGIEGTINELAHGHEMRRRRYRGLDKTHVQHVLTAIAVNIERLSERPTPGEPLRAPLPTAFQAYLDQPGLPRPRSRRYVGG